MPTGYICCDIATNSFKDFFWGIMGRRPIYKGKDRLTAHEREFAEQNHNVIYDYLHKRGLSLEEYYDIAALGYLKAVMSYNRRRTLRRYAFTTIAWRKISSEIHGEWKKHERRKEVLDIVSIDAKMQGSESDLLRMLGADDDRLSIVELKNSLPSEMQMYIWYLLMGYEREQICLILGISEDILEQKMEDIHCVLKRCTGATFR